MLEQDRSHILAQTEGLWDDLRGERIFITGGTGFVGSWLLDAFCAANRAHALNARAVVLTRDPERFRRREPELGNDPAVELLQGDGTSFVFPAGEFAFVIHAAVEEPDRVDPLRQFKRDLETTWRVLDFAGGAKTTRVLFTSTGGVYGTQPPELASLDEEYTGAPLTTDVGHTYWQAKRASELACAAATSGGRPAAVIARLFAFIGPRLPLDLNFAAGNFIGDVLAGRAIRITGDGTPLRSYLYAADLAIWLWTMLLRGEPGRVYNVGSPEALSIRELAERVVAATGSRTEIIVEGRAAPGALPSRYVPSVERAERELGLRPLISLTEGIARTYEWHSAARRSADRRP